MKREVDTINAVPTKRLYLSIISDYDITLALCELIDNALDNWTKGGRSGKLSIALTMNVAQQTITVSDDAGGVKKEELRNIVSPGATSNAPTDATIGIFGVGTKRAVVALAQEVKIRTRHGTGSTYQVEFDDDWLNIEDWDLPLYEVTQIPDGHTIVDLVRLRNKISTETIDEVREHLSSTYARFLGTNVEISLNGSKIEPTTFENWAFPPDFAPRLYTGNLPLAGGKTVQVEVKAGLMKESSPSGGEYGVYIYCNDRLVVRALKSYDVGFTKGIAGLPHPQLAIMRVIVSFKGEAQHMPWNSSKSDLNPKHFVFLALRPWLVVVVKDWASLSRRFEGDWPRKVFRFTSGDVVQVEVPDLQTANDSFLPPMPVSKPHYIEKVKTANRKLGEDKPWTVGLYEGIIAVDIILKQRLEERNRIALILLDSTLEIAFKEYLVNESGGTYSETQLLNIFNSRPRVHNEIKTYVTLKRKTWQKINYYYNLRNKLVHEKSTAEIPTRKVEDYRRIVQVVLKKLFGLKFKV